MLPVPWQYWRLKIGSNDEARLWAGVTMVSVKSRLEDGRSKTTGT
jgi:hypothetical protein